MRDALQRLEKLVIEAADCEMIAQLTTIEAKRRTFRLPPSDKAIENLKERANGARVAAPKPGFVTPSSRRRITIRH